MAARDGGNEPQVPSSAERRAEKPVYLWSTPIESSPQPPGSSSNGNAGNASIETGNGNAETASSAGRPSMADAVASIKKEDFVNVVQTPCARQGFLVGIATGAASGGLMFVVRGAVPKAANWAVGMFLLGSTGSYEYCQFQRRQERLRMKRNIEIVTDKRREAEKKKVEEQAERIRTEREERDRRKAWYKFW